ncbi:MAG: ThuA domain-containing protein [Vicinamibacteria bacterium]
MRGARRSALALVLLAAVRASAQEPAPPRLFQAADRDRDGALTRAELKATFEAWSAEWDAAGKGLRPEQVREGLDRALPRPPQNQTPKPEDVAAMIAALPDKAPATPQKPRRVLVLGRAAGFVHSSIPLAARTIEEMGKKTGAWTTTITYDAAAIDAKTLAGYDAIFLASTTGHFLDDPRDPAVTDARRQALLAFVRGGKGIAGIHAASDSYHQATPPPGGPPTGGGPIGAIAARLVADGGRDTDGLLGRAEMAKVADEWFDKLDPEKKGRVARADFPQRFTAIVPAPPPPSSPPPLGPTGFPVQAPATQLGPDTQKGTWPEWNRAIGGFFKFHWNDGQPITVKVDEPEHPLNAPFKGLPPLVVVDETYTYGRDTYSRQNLRVLTSIDYAAMSAEDKAKEQFPRPDGDYALSWIRREGEGRVFYEAHGHNEKVYAIKPLLAHLLYGMQYVLGDLAADDRPSQKP